MTWPVMSFELKTGSRWAHLMEVRKMATSDGSHERTGMEGVRGAFEEEEKEKEALDLAGVEGGWV